VNFVGELGLGAAPPDGNAERDLRPADGSRASEHGIKPFGIRAMGTMAVEKSYRLIGRELSVEYSAYESGLDRFVHPNKGDFIGRDELVKRHAAGDDWTFVTMEVHGIKDCDARGSEAIYAADGKTLVGRVTTGSYGWRVGQVAGAGHGQAGPCCPKATSSRSRSSANCSTPPSFPKARSIRTTSACGHEGVHLHVMAK
jgi:dimethylglycine dehydrogenase